MRHRKTVFVMILALSQFAAAAQKPTHAKAVAAPAKAVAPEKTNAAVLPSEETVNAFLQQMLGYNNSASWKILEIKPAEAAGLAEVSVVISTPQGQNVNKFYVTQDGEHAVSGEIMPFGAHPFEVDAKKLEQGANGVSRGPTEAAVTLIEFSDFQCPHCKQVQPTLEKLLSEEPNVRLIFQNFPLPNHDWAQKAAAYADCVGKTSSDAFWKFVAGTYDAQTNITAANADEKLTAIADSSGSKGADAAACAAKSETVARVERSIALGQSVAVTSTPTLFLNGRKLEVGGIPYETLKSMVDYAAKPADAATK